jgi:hypothetical protein
MHTSNNMRQGPTYRHQKRSFFLGAALHPNVVGVESYQLGTLIVPQNEMWLRPSVSELIHELQQI